MQISILQHESDSPPSFAGTWLEKNNIPYRVIRAFDGEPMPKIDEVDWLIVLGGGMNIDDYKNYPFLREEKKLVEQVLQHEKSYLGLCLGGQMLARVMGAAVRKHTEWEVGWHPVQIENKTIGLTSRPAKEEIQVFHWHQDTFDVPVGTLPFAKNALTPNQGFINAAASAIGTQFHPEADEAWVKDCANDERLPKGKFAQSQTEILNGMPHLAKQNEWFSDVMKHLYQRTKLRTNE